MALFGWLTKETKQKVEECRTIPEPERQYALHTARKNFLLKGGEVSVVERKHSYEWDLELRPVVLKSLHGAAHRRIVVKSIDDVTLIDKNIGHSSVLDLDGNSIGLQSMALDQIQGLAIIEDLGLDHDVSEKIISASIYNFQRSTKKIKERGNSRLYSYEKNYLFTSSPEILAKAFELNT